MSAVVKRLDSYTFGKAMRVASLAGLSVNVDFPEDAPDQADMSWPQETWDYVATVLHEEAWDETDTAAAKAIREASAPPASEPTPAFDPPLRRLEHYASEAVEAYLGSYNEFDPENDRHQGQLADEVESQVPVMRTDLFQLVVDDNRVGGLTSPHEASDVETYLRDAVVDFVAKRATEIVKERTS